MFQRVSQNAASSPSFIQNNALDFLDHHYSRCEIIAEHPYRLFELGPQVCIDAYLSTIFWAHPTQNYEIMVFEALLILQDRKRRI